VNWAYSAARSLPPQEFGAFSSTFFSHVESPVVRFIRKSNRTSFYYVGLDVGVDDFHFVLKPLQTAKHIVCQIDLGTKFIGIELVFIRSLRPLQKQAWPDNVAKGSPPRVTSALLIKCWHCVICGTLGNALSVEKCAI